MSPLLRPRIELLPAGEPERIVGEACAVLERVGVLIENEEAQELLLAGGGDLRAGRIHLPERLVRAAAAKAPSRIAVYDRSGDLALDLGEDRVHFDPGSAAIHLLDASNWRRREPTSRDAARLARLVDDLPHYAAQSTAIVPADVPEGIADRWRLYLALTHCRKPVVTGTFLKEGFAPMRAMLAAVRGGEQELAAKPLALFDCCPTSPLSWSDLTCQALLDCARAGIPAEIIAVPLTGATSPVTLRETVIQHCAEDLTGVVLAQLAHPGAAVVWGGSPAAFDMRQGTTPMGAIETMMLDVADAQVGKHLGLPTHAYMALSDAKIPDYQAGFESGIGAVLAALAGVNVVSGPGMLDYESTQSLEKLLLDHDACGMALRLVAGIEERKGDAVALISELVARKEFLSHPHTRKHWRQELSIPSPLVDRSTYGDWEAAGARSARERAAVEVEHRLAAAPALPLPDDLRASLTEIITAEARAAGLEDLPATE